MLNVIWPIFIIISVIYAFLCGNIENVSNGIFSSLNVHFYGNLFCQLKHYYYLCIVKQAT